MTWPTGSETNPLFRDAQSLAWVAPVGLFALLLTAETLRPLRKLTRAKLPRLGLNLCMTALVFAVGALAVRPASIGLSTWAWRRPFGLLCVVDLPPAAHFIAGFLLLDLTFYYWHRLNHTSRLLWRFHNVHHLDPDLDVSTSFRFHWGEILYSAAFRAAQVTLIGVSPATLAVYEFVFQCCTMFHHSNVRLPLVLERALNWCFVTPRMHGVHHSVVKHEANSNYSVVLSWWDRLNVSLRVNIPQANVIIGVAGYARKEDNRFWQLMLAPFVKQRNYERWPDGTVAGRESASEGVSPTVMLE